MTLSSLAAQQHHAFTAAQARACGHTTRTIADAVRTRAWISLQKGVYVERAIWAGLDQKGQHACRLHARLLRKGHTWAAARRSATVVHELPYLGRPPERPQLLRDRADSKSQSHDRHERVGFLPPEDTVVVDGFVTTTLSRTWLETAESEDFRNAVVVGDGVLRRGVAQDELIARAATDTARMAAQFLNPLAESALESISRVGVLRLGLPIPQLQIKVIFEGEELARVDAIWEEFNTIGQSDGAFKYKKDPQRVLYDKWQDGRLESIGFEVVRWGWDDAWRQERLRGPLLRGFERGSKQQLAPGVRLVQATLEESLGLWRRAA